MYWVNSHDVRDYSTREMNDFDGKAETQYITALQYECQLEIRTRNKMYEDAQGWFFVDESKLMEVRRYGMKACKRLKTLRLCV